MVVSDLEVKTACQDSAYFRVQLYHDPWLFCGFHTLQCALLNSGSFAAVAHISKRALQAVAEATSLP